MKIFLSSIMILWGLNACIGADNNAPAAQETAPAIVAASNPSAPSATSPVAVQKDANWQNWPLAEGQWALVETRGRATAGYSDMQGRSLFSISCKTSENALTMVRYATGDTPQRLTLATSFGTKTLNGKALSDVQGRILSIDILPSDIVLDQLIFSRGSFGFYVDDQAAIRVTTAPELARVVETCR